MNYFRYKATYINIEYEFIVKCTYYYEEKDFHSVNAELIKIIKGPRFTNFTIGTRYSFNKTLLYPLFDPNDILKQLL